MSSDKLFIEVMQNIQDLTRLLEKAIVLESHLYVRYRELNRKGIPTELESALATQSVQLHDTFKKLEEAIHE